MRPCLGQFFRAGRSIALALSIALSGSAVRGQEPEPAPAKTGALELEWQSDEPGCDAGNVASEAVRLVGSGTPRHIAATAQVWRDGDEWIVQLDTRSSSHTGRRILRSQSCEDLRQALALLLAMILESEADPDEVELPADAPAAHSNAQPPPRPRGFLSEVDWLVSAGGSAAHGLMKPAWSFGVGAGAGLQWRKLEASVRFTYWPVTRLLFEPPPAFAAAGPGDAQIDRTNFTLALCGSFELARGLDLVPCVAPEVTFFRYRAMGIDVVKAGRVKPRLSLSGTVDLRYWLPGQWMFAGIGAGVTWEKRQPFQVRYECEGEGEPECMDAPAVVYTTAGLAPRFMLGVGARF